MGRTRCGWWLWWLAAGVQIIAANPACSDGEESKTGFAVGALPDAAASDPVSGQARVGTSPPGDPASPPGDDASTPEPNPSQGPAPLELDVRLDTASEALLCPGQCIEIRAEAHQGVPPYSYELEGKPLPASGPHRVCPDRTTEFTLTARDADRGSASEHFALQVATNCTPGREVCSARWPVSGAFPPYGPSPYTAADALGQVVVADTLTGTLDFGAGNVLSAAEGSDIALAKLDSACAPIWTRRLQSQGAGSELVVSGVATDSALNIVLVGVMNGSADFGDGPFDSGQEGTLFAVKLDPEGNFLWSRTFGLRPGPLPTVSVAPDGRVVVSGWARGESDYGSPVSIRTCGEFATYDDHCAVIVELSPDGASLWHIAWVGSAQTRTAIDSTGSILATLSSFSPFPDDDAAAIAGQSQVVKLDKAHEVVWHRGLMYGQIFINDPLLFNAIDWNWDRRVSLDRNDNLFHLGATRVENEDDPEPTGLLRDPERWWLAKLTSAGEQVWFSQADKATWQVGRPGAIAADPEGNALIAGDFEGQIDLGGGALVSQGERDLFLHKLDPDGEPIWSARWGGPDGDWIGAVAADRQGNVWLSGWSGSLAGARVRTPLGPDTRTEIFVARLAP